MGDSYLFKARQAINCSVWVLIPSPSVAHHPLVMRRGSEMTPSEKMSCKGPEDASHWNFEANEAEGLKQPLYLLVALSKIFRDTHSNAKNM